MTSDFNKHRFRNFCIGFMLSCLSLWYVFEYRFEVRTNDIICVMPEETEPKGVLISSHQPPPHPRQIEKTSKVVRPPHPLIQAQLKIVTREVAPPSHNPLPKMVAFTGPLPVLTATTSEPIIEHRVDEEPSFPGGDKALRRFLAKHLQYPEDCYYQDLEGTVNVRFVVDQEGNITQIEVLHNDLLQSAEIEAKRVIELMPTWKPAIKNGRPVKTYFIQPFVFTTF